MNCFIEVGNFGAYLNIRWIKNERNNESADRRPFLPTVNNEIEQRRGLTSRSTLENELTAVRSFTRFAGKSIAMGDVTPKLINDYERWLLAKGVKRNTSACYLRSLRAVLNRCGKDGTSLFQKVRTATVRTEKRAIDEASIHKVRNIRLSPRGFPAIARELYLFSIMAMGMPFVDLAHLRKSDVCNGHIIYHRQKTGKRIKVKIEPCMQRIIDQFSKSESPYLFPLLKSGSDQEYLTLLNRYNRALAKISTIAGLTKKLTSYTARHTWASMAYKNGASLAVISKALGHSSPVMTQNYLKEIDDEAIGLANRRFLREFNRWR